MKRTQLSSLAAGSMLVVLFGVLAACTPGAAPGGSVMSGTLSNAVASYSKLLQLMAASGFSADQDLEYPINPPGWTVEARDALLQTPFDHDHGILQVPHQAGLGFDIDRRALARYGRRFFVMDRKRLVWWSLRNRGWSVSREIGAARKHRKDSAR